MIKRRIWVDGQRIDFELHSYPTGTKVMVECPGVLPFDAPDEQTAKDILRSVFSKRAG